MNINDFAYCGLNCTTCQQRFADIRGKIKSLHESFETVNMKEVAKAIPFMNSKYKSYEKLLKFFESECPGCRNKGGNPFCGIRKCAQKKGFETCVECETDMCKKFKMILKVHRDNEIQDNRELIKKLK